MLFKIAAGSNYFAGDSSVSVRNADRRMIGQTVSNYAILEKLGEGGMGVVYKARDTKLDRLVALKFLPHHLTANEAEKARFLQEAKAAAALNHPNVCSVIDIQEHDGQQFIIMEYIDGTTLRQKMPIQKLSDALAYAVQIGEALHEAHGKGIVHRDIKAENIMINSKNQVKVMDFGLAKLKGSLKLTRTSSTVGTLAYMSPEQIQGSAADARSDIFSFGVVLFEMLTGHLPFRGEHEAAMMYSIINEDPEAVENYQSDIPPVLSNLIQRALEKDPNDRHQSVGEMVIEFRRLQKQSTRVTRTSMAALPIPPQGVDTFAPAAQPSVAEPPKASRKGRLAAAGAAILVLIGGAAFWLYSSMHQPKPSEAIQATFQRLTDQPGPELNPSFSPDGNYIIYSKPVAGISHILLQRIGGGNPIDLTKDSRDDNLMPAFSPDGQFIAFRSEREGGGIFSMGATGESARRLTDFGADPSWSPDGKEILFATEGVSSPYGRSTVSKMWAVNVLSGEKRTIFEGDAVQPRWSPHGYRVAYWGLPKGGGQRDIGTIPAAGGTPLAVTNDLPVDWNPVWSPDGKYLYFSSDRGGSLNLWRVPIDEESGKVLGEPAPITTPSGWSGFLSVSKDGSRVVYVNLDLKINLYQAGFDPKKETAAGSPVPITQGSRLSLYPGISPDGKWIAFTSLVGTQEDLYVSRMDGTDLHQLTNDMYRDRGARWSPNGKQIAFYSNRSGHYDIWSINPDGSGLEQLTRTTGASVTFPAWFPDGSHIACVNSDLGTSLFDLTKPLEGRSPQFLPPGINGESFTVTSISPNGERLAGGFSRKTGEAIPGVVLYSLGSKAYTTVSDSGDSPIWLNDNFRLLFQKNGSFWILDSRTKKSHLVMTPPENASFEGFQISTDNQTLVYIHSKTEADIWQATIR